MRKIYLVILLIFIMLGVMGCSNANGNSNVSNKPRVKIEEKHYYHKNVDVVVTNIESTWMSAIHKHWRITFESKEYGLTGETEVTGYDSLGIDIYYGRLQIGDTLESTLYTNTIGDKVVSRELDGLEYP